MDNTKTRQLLKRYLEGKNSSQEKETIEHWYQALEEDGSILPDAKKELLAKQQIWNAIKPALVVKPVPRKLFRIGQSRQPSLWLSVHLCCCFGTATIKIRH